MKNLIIDCSIAGISGDMLLGALIDLGADFNTIHQFVQNIKDFTDELNKIDFKRKKVQRGGITATKIDVFCEETVSERHTKEMKYILEKYLESADLSKKAKDFAKNTLNTIINSEAKLHNQKENHLHFHEMGSFDTLIDIIGVTVALEDLDFFEKCKTYSTPVAVGGGNFKFSHGLFPAPAPASLEILKSFKFPMKGGPVESELATPTGVALLVNLVDEIITFYPSIKPLGIGYGAGSKKFPEVPNLLRIILGEPLEQIFWEDEIYVLETNIDDVTGEIIGFVVKKMMELKGVRDVNIIPMITKKNRPGHIIKVLVDKENIKKASELLMRETGSLGCRYYRCARDIVYRELIPFSIEINNDVFEVRIKMSKDREGNIHNIKAEFDDLKRVAEKTGIPLRELARYIEDQFVKKVLNLS